MAYLRRDPVAPELIGVRRVASQSALSRFFQGFDSAGTNLRCFRRLWHWCLDRLPSAKEGYTLDLDSTRLLHEDGHQQGVAVGYRRQFSTCTVARRYGARLCRCMKCLGENCVANGKWRFTI